MNRQAVRVTFTLKPAYTDYLDLMDAYYGTGNRSEALRKIIDYHRETFEPNPAEMERAKKVKEKESREP